MSPTFSSRHPKSLSEIQAIVNARESESLHLEFKSSAALLGRGDEISKDISAFANADGGTIIYGIEESQRCAERIDDGLDKSLRDHAAWLENVIQSNVSPRLDGLLISEYPLPSGNCIYAVSVPQTLRGPHQDRKSHRYYRRHNFKCEPMEDYEIRDVRNRKSYTPSLIDFGVEVVRGSLLEMFIKNAGDAPARDIAFRFSKDLIWKDHLEPKIFKSGIKSLAPGQCLRFMYGTGYQLDSPDLVTQFSVEATYTHPDFGTRISESFDIDLEILRHTLQHFTDLERHSQAMEKVLKELTQVISKGIDKLEHLTDLASPSGLNISYTAIRALAQTLGLQSSFPKLDPRSCNWRIIQEVLEIDARTALQLHQYFRYPEQNPLSSVKNWNVQLREKVITYFSVEPELLQLPSSQIQP